MIGQVPAGAELRCSELVLGFFPLFFVFRVRTVGFVEEGLYGICVKCWYREDYDRWKVVCRIFILSLLEMIIESENCS